jgi:excisionase family DNA binding protein
MSLLTVREAAARLHVSMPTMRRLIKSGDIPVVVLRIVRGRRTLRVRPETLDRLIRRWEVRA